MNGYKKDHFMNNGNTIVDVAYISEVSCLAVNDGFINDPERVTAGRKHGVSYQ